MSDKSTAYIEHRGKVLWASKEYDTEEEAREAAYIEIEDKGYDLKKVDLWVVTTYDPPRECNGEVEDVE